MMYDVSASQPISEVDLAEVVQLHYLSSSCRVGKATPSHPLWMRLFYSLLLRLFEILPNVNFLRYCFTYFMNLSNVFFFYVAVINIL